MSIMWYVILIATSLPFAISLYAQAESHLTEETNNAKNTYMLRCMISMQRIGIDKYTCAGTA